MVSIAESVRTIAPRRAISREPSASAIVTVAASPSGTAATATETPTRKASRSDSPRASMAAPSTTVTPTPSTTIQRARLPSRACSGVGGGSASSASCGDRTLLGSRAGGDDDGCCAPARCARAGVDHRRPLRERRSGGHGRRSLRHRCGLARQERLVDLEPVGVEHAGVGGNPVALADADDVAGDELAGGDGTLAAVTDHGRDALERCVQGEHGALGPQLLREAEGSVEDDDQPDRRRLDRLADRGRDERRCDEQPDERLDQLAGGDAPVGRAAGAVELVRPVPLESGSGLGRGEAERQVGVELERETVGLGGVCLLQRGLGHGSIIAPGAGPAR